MSVIVHICVCVNRCLYATISMFHMQCGTPYAIVCNYCESVCDSLHTRVWPLPFSVCMQDLCECESLSCPFLCRHVLDPARMCVCLCDAVHGSLAVENDSHY